MRYFSVYRSEAEEVAAVPTGFCLPGVLLSFAWAFAHRLYGLGAALCGAYLALALVVWVVGEPMKLGTDGYGLAFIAPTLIIQAWLGFTGNAWLRRSMARRGLALVAENVGADDAKEALASVLSSPKVPGD